MDIPEAHYNMLRSLALKAGDAPEELIILHCIVVAYRQHFPEGDRFRYDSMSPDGERTWLERAAIDEQFDIIKSSTDKNI